MTGATLHYRAGGNGAFTVTAATDSDVGRVEFGALGQGWTGGGSDVTRPFSTTYSFNLLSAAPSAVTAVAYDASGNASAPTQLSVVGDGAGPAITLTCEPDDCTGQVSLSATDSGSGVATILHSLDGSEPSAPYTTPFLALTEMPLRVRAVDRVGNVGPELARNIGPPPEHFGFTFGDERVNAAGDDGSQTAWIRPGVAGSLRITAGELVDFSIPSAFAWPSPGTGWTVEPDFDTAVYSFTAGAAAPPTVTVQATTDKGPRQSFFRLRHDGTPPAAPAITCACEGHSTVGVEIALSATDSDSGVDRILYSLDGSEPSRLYTGRFTAYTSGALRTRAHRSRRQRRADRHADARHRRLRRPDPADRSRPALHAAPRDRRAQRHPVFHTRLAPELRAGRDRRGPRVRDRCHRVSRDPRLDAKRSRLPARPVIRRVRPTHRARNEPRRRNEPDDLQRVA